MRAVGEHDSTVGVPDVACQLVAAPGGVDADCDRAGQRRPAEQEHVLGHVVEEHADVPARQSLLLEERGARSRLRHHLRPGPGAVVGADAPVRVVGPRCEE